MLVQKIINFNKAKMDTLGAAYKNPNCHSAAGEES